MSECSECLGQRQFWTEWTNDDDLDPAVKALLVEVAEPYDGTALINCWKCGGLDMLRRAALLTELASQHEEVRMCLLGVCQRRGLRGVGELWEKFPDDFLLLESALLNMIEEAGRV